MGCLDHVTPQTLGISCSEHLLRYLWLPQPFITMATQHTPKYIMEYALQFALFRIYIKCLGVVWINNGMEGLHKKIKNQKSKLRR